MKLFVYGTLAPGEPNEYLLKDLGGTWEIGSVKGKYFPSCWGEALGYPGVVLDSEGSDVTGLLFSSDELDKHWKTLDEFEGEGYQRVITLVQLESGDSVESYIYELSEAGLK